ncbi:KamA family radical SAM protein [Candidatus Pacearchaeota archaeon]|nr:KamA family radical SAM protein [Candidatus Pacearchaeota archaeon]
MLKDEQFKEVIEKYPVKITKYLSRLIKKSPAVAKQFLPSRDELKSIGIHRPWVGKVETGIYGLERMYGDRCIIMPINQCPAYCRHCVRKDYLVRSKRAMTYEEIEKALNYIKKHTEIKEVLITGGDPLMDIRRLGYIIKGLRKIKHIGPIRIGTRSIMYDPQRINNKFVRVIKKYHDYREGKPIEISPQFNHPDELTKESIKACRKLIDAGIRLYNQSVLLRGVNDDVKILAELFRKLREIGVEIHYLYHCASVEGADHFRTRVEKGIEIKRIFAGGYLSGRCNPRYIILTPVGKMEPMIDGEILGRKGKILIVKTPYTKKQFIKIDPKFKLPGGCKVDKDDFIICEYLDGA